VANPPLAQVIDQLSGDDAWGSQKCRRCGSFHAPGHCPATRGLQIFVEHLPGYGWRGVLCLPSALGDLMVRHEIPGGMLQSLAQGYDRAQVQGEEVGFLPLILAALSTPQGQQAMQQLGALVQTGVEAAMAAQQGQGQQGQQQAYQPPPPAPPPAPGPARRPRVKRAMRAVLRSLLDEQLADREARSQPPLTPDEGPQPQPEIKAVVAGIPYDMEQLFESPHKLGERFDDDHDWYGRLDENTQERIRQLPVPDPHALVHRIPAMLGASAVLGRAKFLADTWPEFHAFGELLSTTQAIIETEAARLLGDSDAAKGLQKAINERNRRVQAALKVARTMLG